MSWVKRFALALLVLSAGCDQRTPPPSDGNAFQSEEIGRIDGCQIYRLKRGGLSRLFVRCWSGCGILFNESALP